MSRITKKFAAIDEIARSFSSTVYKLDSSNALKRITYEDGIDGLLEIDISVRFQHPNLLSARDIHIPIEGDGTFRKDQYGITYPLMQRSAYQFIRKPSGDDQQCLNFFRQICLGVHHLHTNRICHFDLKLPNILLQDDRAVVADYGLAQIVESPTSRSIHSKILLVTATNRPPENLAGSNLFGYATDIWSLGILGLELLGRQIITDDPSFYTGLIQGYRDEVEPDIGYYELQWIDDIIGVVSGRHTILDSDRRIFMNKVREEGPNSRWYSSDRRRATIEGILHRYADLVEIFSKMLALNPVCRPNITKVCQALHVDFIDNVFEIAQCIPDTLTIYQPFASMIKTLNKTVFLSENEELSQEILTQATLLGHRTMEQHDELRLLLVDAHDDELLILSALACLWIITKMYGHGHWSETMIYRTGEMLPWDLDILDRPGWEAMSWSIGEKLIPSSLLVMERIIVSVVTSVEHHGIITTV